MTRAIQQFLVGFATVVLFVVSGASQAVERYVYSVKFVCGAPDTGGLSSGTAVVHGWYRTDINVQRAANEKEGQISVSVREANGLLVEDPGPTGLPKTTTLTGTEAKQILCFHINNILDPSGTDLFAFRTGFVQIFSLEKLSVTAVYTAKHCRKHVSAREFRRLLVCEGDVTLEVVPYEAVLVETLPGDTEPPN